jgi:hypothetical protein
MLGVPPLQCSRAIRTQNALVLALDLWANYFGRDWKLPQASAVAKTTNIATTATETTIESTGMGDLL